MGDSSELFQPVAEGCPAFQEPILTHAAYDHQNADISGRSIQGRKSMADLNSEVRIPAGGVTLAGNLSLPDNACGIVLFAHGSGSSRHSPRNRAVARTLNEARLATLLFELLTPEEEQVDSYTAHLRFDIALLAERLRHATDWVVEEPGVKHLAVGYFGSSTGGGAALVAASENPEHVKAVVSRGGRPDLAGVALSQVKAPTLLIVGGNDSVVIDLNREAMDQMHCEVSLVLVPGATHLFQEPGALEQVSRLASDWFARHLAAGAAVVMR